MNISIYVPSTPTVLIIRGSLLSLNQRKIKQRNINRFLGSVRDPHLREKGKPIRGNLDSPFPLSACSRWWWRVQRTTRKLRAIGDYRELLKDKMEGDVVARLRRENEDLRQHLECLKKDREDSKEKVRVLLTFLFVPVTPFTSSSFALTQCSYPQGGPAKSCRGI